MNSRVWEEVVEEEEEEEEQEELNAEYWKLF